MPSGMELQAYRADAEPGQAVRAMVAVNVVAGAIHSHKAWLHSDEQLAEVYPFEEWILARSLVGEPSVEHVETDMFAGVSERTGTVASGGE